MGLVDGTEEAPGLHALADKLAKFKTQKDRALAVIVLPIEPSLFYLLGNPQDPVQVWEKLQDQFQKKTWANKLSLLRKLYSLKFEEKDNMQDHIKKITEIFDELSFTETKFLMKIEWCIYYRAFLIAIMCWFST